MDRKKEDLDTAKQGQAPNIVKIAKAYTPQILKLNVRSDHSCN